MPYFYSFVFAGALDKKKKRKETYFFFVLFMQEEEELRNISAKKQSFKQVLVTN